MNAARLALGGLGLALVAVVLVADGLLAGVVPVDGPVGVLGNDYFFAVGLGLLVLVIAFAVLGRSRGVSQARMPEAEASVTVPVPGDDLDDRIARWRVVLPLVGTGTRRAVRDRLREDAVRTLRRSRKLDQGEAWRLVESGDWTDDPVAAGFLARGGGERSSDAWSRALGRLETPLRYRTRRTVDAIAAIGGGGAREGAA